MTRAGSPVPIRDRRVATVHGLQLHVRDWRPLRPAGEVVLCLPGLTRPLEDFTELAERLSSPEGGGRRVVAVSMRGRGASDRDPDPRRYDVRVEIGDIVAVLDALGLAHGVVLGTSRGGLHAMALAAIRPGFASAVILNDIGPAIDARGLIRIRSYLSAAEALRDWDAATQATERLLSERFPALGRADFERIARRTWRDAADGLETQYDPKLIGAAFAGLDLEKPLPSVWPLFDALASVPLMAIRGEHSDILAPKTLEAMNARRPDMTIFESRGQGHAPQLADPEAFAAIEGFLAASDS